jgi:sarcosine oxidase
VARHPADDLVVVGAGAMGGWTAFWAQTGGRSVTLLDAWGPGNARSSSGDETRITRAAHGADELYTRWSRRALEHWKHFQDEWGTRLFEPCGVLWFAGAESSYERESQEAFGACDVPSEWLTPDELTHRWTQVAGGGLAGALFEPEAGALYAQRACQAVADAFARAGGRFELAAVRPGASSGRRLHDVVDGSGRRWAGAQFVFACGPWLPLLFPEVLGQTIRATKQDVLFFGSPAADSRFTTAELPAWCDFEAAYYGIGATAQRGMKLGPDRYGPIFDPTRGERVVDPESVRLARDYLRKRFPALAEAPVIESRVCQYETTPDGHFLLAPHPDWDNVWLAGGGSGHGFKHGPRIGEYLVARIEGAAEGDQDGPEEARFRLGPRVAASAARSSGDEMAAAWEPF